MEEMEDGVSFTFSWIQACWGQFVDLTLANVRKGRSVFLILSITDTACGHGKLKKNVTAGYLILY